jgi:hypothetical protein
VVALGECSLRDLPSLRASLREHDIRLAAGLLPELFGAALGRHEGLPEQRLEVAVARDVRLQALVRVLELASLPPDLFEAVRDLLEQAIGRRPPVA